MDGGLSMWRVVYYEPGSNRFWYLPYTWLDKASARTELLLKRRDVAHNSSPTSFPMLAYFPPHNHNINLDNCLEGEH